MKKVKEDLRFVNYLRTLERALHDANRIILDSQQREELTESQVALIEKIHEKFYWPEEVGFDKKCVDPSRLKVQ